MTQVEDLVAELERLRATAASPEEIEGLLADALDALREVIPFDLASVLELRGRELSVRIARGPLASPEVRRHRISLEAFPSIARSLDERRPVAFLDNDHAGEEGDPYDGVLDLPHGHSCMVVPLHLRDRSLGILTFDQTQCVPYSPEILALAGSYGKVIALALFLAEHARALGQRLRAEQEAHRLVRAELRGGTEATERMLASRVPALRRLAVQAQQVAETSVPVLITGETGTGKEVLAQALHDWSPRRDAPFLKINCAALPENLVESELFGHEAGAFSGAAGRRPGRFQAANGGTLLLDELGELPPGIQAKLLRVLQEGTFEPVGSDRSVRVDVRVLAATHVDLEEAVRSGRFREDLFYRLAVFPLELPPLRERLEDLPELATTILGELARTRGRGPWVLSEAGRDHLARQPWPGNLRELRNVLERATILVPSGRLGPGELSSPVRPPVARALPPGPREAPEPLATLAEIEVAHLERVLTHTRGKVYGPGGAAEILDMKPTTLQARLRKRGIRRKEFERV